MALFHTPDTNTYPLPHLLQQHTFKGFYYDHDEKNYELILNCNPYEAGITLTATETHGYTKVAEYSLKAHSYRVEPISQDKVGIDLTAVTIECKSDGPLPNLPACFSISLHLLSPKSIFLSFRHYDQLPLPLNTFGRGLILSVCDKASSYGLTA